MKRLLGLTLALALTALICVGCAAKAPDLNPASAYNPALERTIALGMERKTVEAQIGEPSHTSGVHYTYTGEIVVEYDDREKVASIMLTQPAASCEWQVMGGITLSASVDEILLAYGADAASWSGDTLFFYFTNDGKACDPLDAAVTCAFNFFESSLLAIMVKGER